MPSPSRPRATIRILALVNFVTLLLSLIILAVGIWLSKRDHGNCPSFIQWPFIVIGIVVFVISLMGLLGAKRRLAWLLWMYLGILSIVILLLLAFTVFAFVVKKRGVNEFVGSQLKGYDPGDYSPWLRSRECQVRFFWAVKNDWNKMADASITVLVFLIVVYCIAWYAFISAMTQQLFAGVF